MGYIIQKQFWLDGYVDPRTLTGEEYSPAQSVESDSAAFIQSDESPGRLILPSSGLPRLKRVHTFHMFHPMIIIANTGHFPVTFCPVV